MARGWESKFVEEQISEKESDSPVAGKSRLTPAQVERRTKYQGLLLARSRTLSNLESSRDPRFRALMERTLAALEAEIAKLGD